ALFEQAWLIASLDSQIARIRSGHILLAVLSAPDLAQFAQRMSPLFAKVRITDLKHKFDELTQGSRESEGASTSPENATAADETPRANAASRTPALDTYTT